MLFLSGGFMFHASILALLASLAAPASEGALDPDDAPGPEGAPSLTDEPRPEAAPAPAGFAVGNVKTIGSGCPTPGSVSVKVSAGAKTLSLTYQEMTLGRPAGAIVQFTNCMASFTLAIPAGWQVSPGGMDVRGEVDLASGITARQTSKYSFAGSPGAFRRQSNFAGPQHRPYQVSEDIPADSTVWSPCGGAAIFVMEAQLQLNAKNGPAGAASFSIATHKLSSWKWRQC